MALGNREVGIELRARDMASQALGQVGSSLGAVGDKAEATGGRFGALGRVMGTVGQGMQLAFGFSVAGKIAQGLNLVKSSAIDFNAKLEQWRIAFKQTLGSAEAANDFIAKMKEFSAKTPFEMPGLVDAAQKLTGAGMAAKDVIPTLTALGDAIAGAGKGQEYVVSATNSLTKMMRAGRATGESMMYLSESGVNAWKYLAESLGVSIPEAQKMVTKGQVTAQEALKAIRDGVAKSDLGGMMDVQSRTFNGAMSTINDQLRNVLAEGFEPLFKVISAGALTFANFLGSSGWTDWGPRVAGALNMVIGAGTGLMKIVGAIFDLFRTKSEPVKAVSGLVTTFSEKAAALRDLLEGAEGKFLSFIAQFELLRPVIGPVSDALLGLNDILVTFASGGLGAVMDSGPKIDSVIGSLERAGELLRGSIFSAASETLGTMATRVGDLKAQFEPLAPIIEPVAATLQSLADAASAFASGDLVGALEGVGGALSNYASILPGVATAFDQWLTSAGPAIEGFVDKAVEWLGTELPSVLEKITPVVQGMVEKFMVIGPEIAGMVIEWGQNLVDWISPMIPPMLAALSDWAQEMFSWLLSQLPVWAGKLMALGTELVDWITASIPGMITAITGWAQSLFDWIINTGVPQAAAAIGPLALKFVDWVFETLPKLLDALDEIIGAIINFIATNGPVLIGKLLEWAVAFVGWIATEVIPRLIENLPTILRTILLFLGGALGKIVGKAGEIGSGLVGKLIGFVRELPGKVANLIGQLPGKIGGFIGSVAAKAGELGGKVLNGIIDFVVKLPGRIADILPDLLLALGKWGLSLGEKARKIAGGFVGGIIDTVKGLPGRVFNFLKEAIGNLFRSGFSIGPLRISSVGIFLAGAQVASFDVGSWKVPKDMPAIVHEGEMIIPAQLAGAIRSLAGGGSGSVQRAAPFPAKALGLGTGGGNVTITITNNFGRDSIRNDSDITRISREMAVQARMQGFTPSVRALSTTR